MQELHISNVKTNLRVVFCELSQLTLFAKFVGDLLCQLSWVVISSFYKYYTYVAVLDRVDIDPINLKPCYIFINVYYAIKLRSKLQFVHRGWRIPLRYLSTN